MVIYYKTKPSQVIKYSATMTASSEESQNTIEDTFIPTRNYTSPDEKSEWWYLARQSKDWKWYTYASKGQTFELNKEKFRTRRTYRWEYTLVPWYKTSKKALRLHAGNSDEIGAFARLTSSYLLVGGDGFENFSRTVKGDLPEIPVIDSTLAGCRVIGRMCVGNKHGLVVPDAIYDTELRNITDGLPDSVKVRKVEEKLSALGNVITCNDKVALIHPDLDKETEEIIGDTLQVEVFRHTIGHNPLVGSCCVLNNAGGLVCTDASNDFIQNLSSLLQLPLTVGSVNNGNKAIASGLIANDMIAYAGMKTTSNEFKNIEDAFHLDKAYCTLWY